MGKHTLPYTRTLHKVTQTTAQMIHKHTNTHEEKHKAGTITKPHTHTHVYTNIAQITRMPTELNALSDLNALTHKYTQLYSQNHCETAWLDTNTQTFSFAYTHILYSTHTNT